MLVVQVDGYFGIVAKYVILIIMNHLKLVYLEDICMDFVSIFLILLVLALNQMDGNQQCMK